MNARHRAGGTVITANRLPDGRVIFLGPGGWSEDITAATVATDAQELRALEALARQSVAVCEVVDPYPVAVEAGPDGLLPVKLRERRRLLGPSPGAETVERSYEGEPHRVSL